VLTAPIVTPIPHAITGFGGDGALTVSITRPAATVYSPFVVTFVFSESVSDFVIGDITVVNGTPSGFAGAGTTYTVTITPTAEGTVTVSLAAGVATGDVSGLGNLPASRETEFLNQVGQPIGLLLALTKS
jgi:hypothetical protein